MKILFSMLFSTLIIQSYSQTARVLRTVKDNKQILAIVVDKSGEPSKTYFASCYFKEATKLPDSVKIFLIEQLLHEIGDTSYSYQPVEALSYRYSGRYNKMPKSKIYNAQVATLILVNYIAFSGEAVEYSPYPVLYDKKEKKEISTAGNDLNEIIRNYREWFKKIKRNGLKNYQLPLLDKKYEWYGSLYSKQRVFEKPPEWRRYYDCPVLTKEED